MKQSAAPLTEYVFRCRLANGSEYEQPMFARSRGDARQTLAAALKLIAPQSRILGLEDDDTPEDIGRL